MNPLKDQATGLATKLGVGGLAALATGAVLVAGIGVVGAANGADDRPSTSPVTVSMPGDDDGTPDQGSGDAPGTPGGPSTTVTSTTVAPPTTAPGTTAPGTGAPAAPASVRTVPVAGVGVVVFDEATLALVSATPAPGFTVRSESSARELHVRFFAPDGGRIDVQVEVEDGAVRVRVRDRRTEDGGRGRGGDDSPSTTVVPAPAPSPTVDDHGGDRDRDDRIEPGDDRDDRSGDDSSGRGRGGDDDHDDDSSGHGGGDD